MDQANRANKEMKSLMKSMFDSRKEYFIQNGGILLAKQIALSQGRNVGSSQLRIFSGKDIVKGTNNLDSDLLLGRCTHRNFYKGTLEDRNVAIGVPLQSEPNLAITERNLTEASVGMIMNHSNMIKLYGCCLESVVPILVYEMFPNGNLSQNLHGDIIASNKPIKWGDRLRVAIDTAYALSYMHNSLRKPLVHRGVNSASILLDNSCHAKLANFGYSVSITPGDTSQRWPVQGTPGYVDPEYIQTQLVTDKCDVYSFGVLMLELLTRKNPSMLRGERGLVDMFTSDVDKDRMMKMIDCEVLEQATRNEIQQFAQIAVACVAKKGAERPTMIEVVVKLRQIHGHEN